MRIVCDSCGTKYSISDEKVRGKLFKFRCKNCSHVIIVRGNQEPPVEDPEPQAAATDPAAEAAAADEWFFVLDGEQAGPIGTDEIADYISSGQIEAETYMWREGMDDWLHITAIPELVHLAHLVAAPEEPADEPAEGGNGQDYGPSVFAGTGDEEIDYSGDEEATRVTAAPSDDPPPTTPIGGLFDGGLSDQPADSLAPSFAGGGDLFGDTETERPSGASSGGGLFGGADGLGMATATDLDDPDRLVGQRNENSVLFSLDTLQDVEGGDSNGSDLPTTEGSGLIDIKALAASQAATAGAPLEGVENISGDSSIATPAVMPMGQRQSHKLLYSLIAAGAVIILGLVTAIVVVLSQDKEEPVQQAAANPAEGETTETEPSNGEPEAAVETETEAAAETEPVAPQGPTPEQISNSAALAGLMSAHISNRSQANAQAIADRPAERVASRSSRSSRSSRDDDDDDDDDRSSRSSRSSRDDDDDDRSSRSSRDDDRSSRSSRNDDEEADPVSAALSQIRRDDDDDDDDRGSSNDEPADDSGSSRNDDLPEQLTTSQVSRTIRRYNRRLSQCRSQSDIPSGEVLRVDVSMTLQGNGRVASARTDSSDAAADCLVDVVRDMRFDEFSGDAMDFTYPFRVR